jgi:hypothetical protein
MQRIPNPVLALTALILALNACQTTAPDRFDQADKNHDGALSRDEINTHLVTAIFDSRDTSHDQKMTKTEWVVGNDPGQEKLFRERDANRDGIVTLDEALDYGRKKGTASQFTREADKNKDGAVSRQEMTDYYASKEGPAR